MLLLLLFGEPALLACRVSPIRLGALLLLLFVSHASKHYSYTNATAILSLTPTTTHVCIVKASIPHSSKLSHGGTLLTLSLCWERPLLQALGLQQQRWQLCYTALDIHCNVGVMLCGSGVVEEPVVMALLAAKKRVSTYYVVGGGEEDQFVVGY